ncbi:metalloprotease [Coemansia erecta]|nr:metalloprotease [Coemansia erecta]
MWNRLVFWALAIPVLIELYRWYRHNSDQHGLPPDFVARTTSNLKLPYFEFGGKLRQPVGDLREHKLIRLPNNLVIMCTRDFDTTQAAASLSVNVGGLADPSELNGLAHFLEHMLFMYPDEDEYIGFINKHSGEYNAFTSMHTTTYFFGIANSALEEMLDRFSRFFIDPLFAPGSVERELLAVDSEHKGNLQSDSRRDFQIKRTLSNPDHPFSYFSTGNLETLRDAPLQRGIDIRQEVIQFYEQYYSADIMKLAVVGNHSIDQLVEWTVAMFSDIESKGQTQPQLHTLGHPLTPDVLGKLVRYQTLGSTSFITLQFALPELKAQYKTRPDIYVERLIERHAPGSLFHYLKKRGWAADIYAGILTHGIDGFNLFEIGISMTPQGLEHYSDIVRAVFAYLHVLAADGPQQRIYDEMRAVKDLNHRFYETPAATRWVLGRSQACHNQHILPGDFLLAGKDALDFNSQDVAEFMQHLHPQNYRVFVGAQDHGDVELNITEKYYGTLYRVDDLPSDLTDKTILNQSEQYGFYLPPPNPFISEATEVVGKVVPPAEIATAPTLLQRTDAYELWFKQDDQFARPRGYIRLQIAYARTAPTSRDHAVALLLDEFIAVILKEELNDAKSAGLKYKVHFLATVADIEVSGFSAKLPKLIDTIVQRLKMLNVDKHIFQDSLTQVRQACKNMRNQQPFRQLQLSRHPQFNLANSWSPETLEQQLDNVTMDRVQELATSALDCVYTKILISGNFHESDAIDTARNVQQILASQPLSASEQVHNQVVAINPGHYIHRTKMLDTSSLNGAVLATVYCGFKDSVKDTVVTTLLARIIESPFFDELRTREQLGYMVMASKTSFDTGRLMLLFNAQSEVNPAYLTQRINKFIRDTRQHIVGYSAQDFDTLVQSQIALKAAKLKSIEEEAEGFWQRIASGAYDFDYIAQEIAQLNALDKGDLLKYWDMYVNPDTAVDYTRIDSQLWSTKIAYPEDNELAAYPESVIALFGCLDSEGLIGVGIEELHKFVQHISLSDGINVPLSALAELYSSKQAHAQALERIPANNSRIGAALDMALREFAQSTINNASDSSTSGHRRQTLDGRWIIDDIDSFKATQKLFDLPNAATSLVPKYDI